MTVNLNLRPELEAELVAQAQESGMTVDSYLLSVIELAVRPSIREQLSPEQRAAAFEAWSFGHRPTQPLSDYAVSREGMYHGRDS
jgi:hypothetical protein